MEDKFYEKLSRRTLIDVISDAEEEKFWQKSFEDSNDITLYSWRTDWIKNLKGNKEHFGYFHRDHSVKVFANELLGQPVLLLGAGPSLQNNIQYLKLAKELDIKIIATHHALMYLSREDVRVKPDYTVVLDAGCMWDEYYGDKEFLKDVPLIADQTCNTEQLKEWKGPVYFYKSAHPEKGNIAKFLKMEMDRVVKFTENGSLMEVGGHAMGAMMSVARGIMSAETIIFAGCDYCFNNEGKFYPFDHKIDQEVDGKHFGAEGKTLPAAPPAQGQIYDIFGNMVATNGSYLGFKNVMDQGIKVNAVNALQNNIDLEFINASEGGALGALSGGNSKWMRYMRLEDALISANAKRKFKEEKK